MDKLEATVCKSLNSILVLIGFPQLLCVVKDYFWSLIQHNLSDGSPPSQKFRSGLGS
jgi:hypothetical protein